MLTAAVCFALTAGGVAVAGVRAHRRRYLSAARWFAVALLPAGFYLTGLLSLFRTIGGEFADWVTGLVFDPRVWVGLVLLAVSAGVLAATRRVGRRRVEDAGRGPAAAGAAPGRPAVTGAPQPTTGRGATGGRGGRRADDDAGEFADVEEILRRRGI